MRKNILTSIVLGLASFTIYFFTMPSSVYIGDSGEIATAIYIWGIAHPTGFPVYLILAKLFSYLIPFGEFALKLNIFSALTSATTIGILFLILQKLRINPAPFDKSTENKKCGINYWIGIAASLSLAFGYTFWTHAQTIQTYSLSILFFVLAIFIFLNWLEQKKNWQLILVATICGLGAGTHLTFLLIFPFLFIYLVVAKQKVPIKKIIICFFVFLFFCFLAYSYIYFRAKASPELNWENPSTPERFFNYITQKDYAAKIGSRSYESWAIMSHELVRIFSREFTWLGLVAVLIGATIAFRQNRPFFYAGLSVVFFNIFLLGNYGNNEDIVVLWRYFLPSYAVMAIFIGFALSRITKKTEIALILPAIIFFSHLAAVDKHDNILIPKTTQIMFDALPQGSIFVTGGDTLTGSAMYKQTVLGQRKDILLISQPLFTHDWYREKKKKEMENKGFEYSDDLTKLIGLNSDREAYALSNSMGSLNINYDFFPRHTIYKMFPKKEENDYSSLIAEDKAFWEKENLDFLKPTRLEDETLSDEVVNFYTGGLNNLAAYITNHEDIPGGIKYFTKSLEIRENKNALYNLWGINNALGKYKEAEEYKDRFDKLVLEEAGT